MECRVHLWGRLFLTRRASLRRRIGVIAGFFPRAGNHLRYIYFLDAYLHPGATQRGVLMAFLF